MKTVLEVKNLSKSFEDTHILSNINFKVEEGEFIAIMGQSGSGKSTLLYSISGMDRPTSGNILLCGNDISKLTDESMSSDWKELILVQLLRAEWKVCRLSQQRLRKKL